MQRFNIHPEIPQKRLVRQVLYCLENNQIGLIPTDTTPVLVCALDNFAGKDRIRQFRQLDKNHYFTLLTSSLTNMAKYVSLSNEQFRLIKKSIPGPFTFVLPATRSVPKKVLQEKRKTIGIRVPNSPIMLSILSELDLPLVSVSAFSIEEHNVSTSERLEILNRLYKSMDFAVVNDDNDLAVIKGQTTVLDCSCTPPDVLRHGLGKYDG